MQGSKGSGSLDQRCLACDLLSSETNKTHISNPSAFDSLPTTPPNNNLDFENDPWHLPSTGYYGDFVHEVHSNGGATPSASDGEPDKYSFYDTLQLESGEDGDLTNDSDGLRDEFENSDASENGDEVVYENSDHANDATII